MIKLAAQNAQRVKSEGRCELPQQRCETIRSPHHPDDTVFLPRCALLHRCSEDTGCCLSDDNICAPSETETVELFFYTFVRPSCMPATKMQFRVLQNNYVTHLFPLTIILIQFLINVRFQKRSIIIRFQMLHKENTFTYIQWHVNYKLVLEV